MGMKTLILYSSFISRVKLDDEELDSRYLWPKSTASANTVWIDLSLVKRDRTPRWAIKVGIRFHLSSLSLRDVNTFLESSEINRNHIAIRN